MFNMSKIADPSDLAVYRCLFQFLPCNNNNIIIASLGVTSLTDGGMRITKAR